MLIIAYMRRCIGVPNKAVDECTVFLMLNKSAYAHMTLHNSYVLIFAHKLNKCLLVMLISVIKVVLLLLLLLFYVFGFKFRFLTCR